MKNFQLNNGYSIQMTTEQQSTLSTIPTIPTTTTQFPGLPTPQSYPLNQYNLPYPVPNPTSAIVSNTVTPSSHVYTPFNSIQQSSLTNPLSQVTVAISPQLIRPSQPIIPGVPIGTNLHNVGGLGNMNGSGSSANVYSTGTIQMMGNLPNQTITPSQPPQPSFNDANNDASSWTEHEGDDGRIYWHNRVTKVGIILTFSYPLLSDYYHCYCCYL